SQQPQKEMRAHATLRHPLRDTASHPRPLGVARLAMAYPTLRSSTFRSAPLFGSGDQGPLFSMCPIWLAGFRLARRNPTTLQSVVNPTPPCGAATPPASPPPPPASPPSCSESPSPPSAAAPR